MTKRIAASPPGVPFLAALARAWLDVAERAGQDPAAGLIILPTRRAARAATAAFLEVRGGAMVLPRIAALGAPDEAGLAIAGDLDLPPAIEAPERRAILARLILGMRGRDGAPTRLAEALDLAGDLALLIDAAGQAEVDLAETLPRIVAPELAEHWQRTLDFLRIVTHHWPAILAARGAIDPARRQRLLLDAQRQAWEDAPPDHPVWLAGLATATPAASRLARTIASLDQGLVALPGFDPDMPDAAWEALADSPTHPQAGFHRLLAAIGARRDEVVLWSADGATAPRERVALLRRAFLPSAALADWQTRMAGGTEGVYRLAPLDEQDEARAIALALRDALETPESSAALVTPDRGLAVAVAAELARSGIRAEDSAGEILAATPPAVFLRLLAEAWESDFAAVPFLALLKHPLAAPGRNPAECRRLARRLDVVLRKRQPGAGFTAMRYAAEHAIRQQDETEAPDPDLVDFLADVQARLRPLLDATAPARIAPATLLEALIDAGEALSGQSLANTALANPALSDTVLWAGEAGGALADHLAAELAALAAVDADIEPAELPALLVAVIGSARLRRPRARDANPRVAIWGVMEARLQSVDTLILGGMVEGVLPGEPDPGPWLSRPMRRDAGLPDQTELIGETAHDVTSLIATCPTVILSAPRRRDRAPAVPSRFLARIETMLRGSGLALAPHPATGWAAMIDRHGTRTIRPRPEPRPPAQFRPNRYSISEIATLIADPYAIYASRVLKLRELDPLEAETDAILFGTIVHDGLEAATTGPTALAGPEAVHRLKTALEVALAERRVRPALEAFWRVRLERIADWIVGIERERHAALGPPEQVSVEVKGDWAIGDGGFLVRGRADRIERRPGSAIAIIDYKTGTPARDAAVESGDAPQLPLEAVIAEAGGFGPDFHGTVTELAYWKLSGGATEGQTRPVFGGDAEKLAAVIDNARQAVPRLLARYAEAATPYLDAPHPARATYGRPYAGVSRRAEWEDEA